MDRTRSSDPRHVRKCTKIWSSRNARNLRCQEPRPRSRKMTACCSTESPRRGEGRSLRVGTSWPRIARTSRTALQNSARRCGAKSRKLEEVKQVVQVKIGTDLDNVANVYVDAEWAGIRKAAQYERRMHSAEWSLLEDLEYASVVCCSLFWRGRVFRSLLWSAAEEWQCNRC